MCLEIIEDILAEVEDSLISDLDEEEEILRSALPEAQQSLFDKFTANHYERSRKIAKSALLAGVAMGRGLGVFLPESGYY